jgi:CubicO group peptidase (beta-lactamase class C family)
METTKFHAYWIAADGVEGGSGEPTALFPYWSFTKTVIAICALKLHENDVVDLDTRLADEVYSLRQLLNHTAGLADYGALQEYRRDVAANGTPWPREKLLEAARARGRLFAPGEGWAYSNVGYMLARERLEAASGQDFARLVDDLVCRPLGFNSVELATSPEQFSRIHWKAAGQYHPGWVYHGCLMGNARDAARILNGLFSGRLLTAAMFEQMISRRPLGGAIPGRPWTDCGYGLGLMIGGMTGAGKAIGHSGAGPFSSNAVYHFHDRDIPVTIACFAAGGNEGPAEFEAARLAQAE